MNKVSLTAGTGLDDYESRNVALFISAKWVQRYRETTYDDLPRL
jgi:hypothetical protein